MKVRGVGQSVAIVVAVAVLGVPTGAAAKKPTLSLNGGGSVAEGNVGTTSVEFTAKLSKKAKKTVKASFSTVDGSATAPGDYAAASGTVTVKRKHKSATFKAVVTGDTTFEPDEMFSIALSKPKGAKLGTASAAVTIQNDDAQPTGADLQLTGLRQTPATVRGGLPVNEQLTVTNNGPQAADGVTISTPLPAATTLNAMWTTPSCTASAGTTACQLGSLAPGASSTVVLAIAMPVATTTQNFSISATASATAPADPVPGNASYVDSFSVPAANLTIATSAVSMPRDGATERKQEVALGDAVADSYRQTYSTDFAYTTGGSLRSAGTCDLSPVGPTYCPSTSGPPYSITRGAIISTLPFGNRVVTFTLSGIELRAALEKSVFAEPAAAAAFLQISGLCFTWTQSLPAGSRVSNVVRQAANGSCTGAAIPADGTTYTVATSNFTASGGDGHADFSSRTTLRGYDADVFSDWASTHSPLNPVGGRITALP